MTDPSDPFVVAWSGERSTTEADGQGYATFEVRWCNGSTESGVMHALQWTEDSSNAPASYVYGSTSATLETGTTPTVDVELSEASVAEITGTISVPSGFPAPGLTLNQRFEDNSHDVWEDNTESIDAAVPLISAGTATLYAETSLGDAEVRYAHPAFTGDTDVSFELPEPPAPTSPSDNTAGVDHDTEFEFEAPGGVHLVTITLDDSDDDDGARYQIVTTSQSVTIPDVPELPLLAGRDGTWRVETFGPFEDVDAAATEGTLFPVDTGEVGEPRFQALSAERDLETAP